VKRKDAPAAAEPQPQCLCMGMGPKVTAMLKCRSGAAQQHLNNARVEFLKAVRAMIDDRIDELGRSRKKGTSVTVE